MTDSYFGYGKRLLIENANDVLLPLSCFGPSSPTVAAAWSQFLDPDIARAMFYGGVRTQHVGVLPAFWLEPIDLTDMDPATIVDAFLKTSGAVRGRLEVVLNRLNRAVRLHRVADQALDLAIALETLLGDKSPGENTYKVSLRAGLLDTGAPQDRQRSRAVAGALYAVRSAVVHSGQVPEKVKLGSDGKRPAHEIVTAALQLLANLTRCAILQGRLPHWYTYELGILDP